MFKPVDDYPPIESAPAGEYQIFSQVGIGIVGEGEATWLILLFNPKNGQAGLYRSKAGIISRDGKYRP